MSVLGWDGFTLAADRAVFRSGVVSPISKIIENDKFAAGFVGRHGAGAAMAAWAMEGARADRFQLDEWKDSEVLLVDKTTGKAFAFDGHYVGIELTFPTAIGETAASGALLGMMLVGVPVEIAVDAMVRSGRFDAVGFGVQAVKVRERPVIEVPEPVDGPTEERREPVEEAPGGPLDQ